MSATDAILTDGVSGPSALSDVPANAPPIGVSVSEATVTAPEPAAPAVVPPLEPKPANE